MAYILKLIKKIWPAKIRSQLILGVALVHLFMMTIFVFDLVTRHHKFLEEQNQKQAQSLAETFAVNASSWLLANDLEGLEEVVLSHKNFPNLQYAMILSTDGVVLAHTNRTLIGSKLKDSVSLSLKPVPKMQTLVKNRSLLDVATPVLNSEKEIIGWARIGQGQKYIHNDLLIITRDGVIYTLVAILIGSLLAMMIGNLLTRGLNKLVHVTDKIREGYHDVRAADSSSFEIAELGKSINQMLDEIVASENRFRNMADAAPVLIWMSGLDKRCSYFNKTWLRFTGRTIEQEIGDGWAGGVHPEDLDNFIKIYTAHFDEHKEFTVEYRLRRHDGSYRWLTDHGTPRFLPDGTFVGYIGSCIDITERKETEEELLRLNKAYQKRAAELATSNIELEQFAYVASHDLQEPLRVIKGFIQLIEKRIGKNLDEETRKFIGFTIDGAERMKHLIQDLLEFSRMGTTKEPATDVNCNEVLKTVSTFLSMSIQETGATLHVKPLPVIKAIQSQIEHLFQNLVGNAMKYHSNKPPEIEVGCTEQDDMWQFYIKDNGIGIDQKFFDKIFVLFQRLHNRSEYSGTGIGLAICKKIVERHGGHIWVESTVGNGSTFYFTIPK